MQRTSAKGFTVPELLVSIVIASAILAGLLVVLVNLSTMGGANIAATNQVRETQLALATVKNDIMQSAGFLTTPSTTPADPDIAVSPTGTWSHIGQAGVNNPGNPAASTKDRRILILKQRATTKPEQDPTKQVIYLQSGGCPLGRKPVYTNVIYFVRDETLYRRTLVPAAITGDPYCNGATISQQQTCRTPGTPPCTEKDVAIASGITQFSVTYYSNPSDMEPDRNEAGVERAYDTVAPITQDTMNSISSVKVTLTKKANIDGNMTEYSTSLRTMRDIL